MRHLPGLVLLLALLPLPLTWAQQPAPTGSTAGAIVPQQPLPGAANTGEPPPAALVFLFAAAFTIITLLILCMPTRKA